MSDKRRERRLLCAELVQVKFQAESGRQCHRVANLEDISPTGLCLQSETRIPDGVVVKVNYGHGEFMGIVKYCIFRDTGFMIGVEFGPGCRWSEGKFQPEHLLDPQGLSGEVVQ